MICSKCCIAGSSFQIGDIERAVELHEQCEYGSSCACQHQVTVSVQRKDK